MTVGVRTISKSLEGPLVLSYTRQGIIPHIAQPSTLIPNSIQDAVYVPLEHFIDLCAPCTTPSSNRSSQKKDWNKGVHEYCALAENSFVVAGSFEPTRGRKKAEWVSGTSKALGFVASSTNRILATPNMLKEVVHTVKPNALVLIDPSLRLFNGIEDHDLQIPPIQTSASQERKAHNRWITFISGMLGNANEKCEMTDSQIWICVGGSKPEGIKHSTLHIKEEFDPKISLYGICLPTPPHRAHLQHSQQVEKQLTSIWEQNIDAFIQHAPVEKPRFIIGVSNFKHIVMAISKGFDILDDSWIEKESLDGQALFVTFGNSISKDIHQDEKNERVSKQGKLIYTFDLTPNGKRESKKYGLKSGSESSSITVSPVDVWKTDTNPLSQSCKCWTCTRPHSRAYIHHLLCVNDMLAYVMLQHHNLHQLHQFVADIKASIKDGSFEEKASEFSLKMNCIKNNS